MAVDRKYPPTYRAVKRRMTDEEIIAAYVAGDDFDTIGHKAGVHGSTARNVIRAAGVPLRPPERGRRYNKPALDELAVCQRYRAGESGIQLAAAFATTEARIYGILRRCNEPRRNPVAELRKRHKAERQRRAPGDG